MNKCKECGRETKNSSFCSRSCSATNTNRRFPKRNPRVLVCANCGNKIPYNNTRFCSQECSSKYKANSTLNMFLENNYIGRVKITTVLRTWLLNRVENKCEKCGWGETNPYSNNVALDIHHKDGNRRNNTLENIEILCPNCHSLTETYKYLNKK